jgi:hypothetical protein
MSVNKELKKTNAPGYFVNENGIIINDDELAWMKYKAEREASKTLIDLVHIVEELKNRIVELERKFNETITSN